MSIDAGSFPGDSMLAQDQFKGCLRPPLAAEKLWNSSPSEAFIRPGTDIKINIKILKVQHPLLDLFVLRRALWR